MAKNHHSSDQQMCCEKVLNQIALKSAQQEKSGKIYKGSLLKFGPYAI
jgi:hypothetical protein